MKTKFYLSTLILLMLQLLSPAVRAQELGEEAEQQIEEYYDLAEAALEEEDLVTAEKYIDKGISFIKRLEEAKKVSLKDELSNFAGHQADLYTLRYAKECNLKNRKLGEEVIKEYLKFRIQKVAESAEKPNAIAVLSIGSWEFSLNDLHEEDQSVIERLLENGEKALEDGNEKKAKDYYLEAFNICNYIVDQGIYKYQVMGTTIEGKPIPTAERMNFAVNSLFNIYNELFALEQDHSKKVANAEQVVIAVSKMIKMGYNEKAMHLVQSNLHGHLSLLNLLLKENQKAKSHVEQGLQLAANNTWVTVNLAYLLLLEGQFEKAEAIFMDLKGKEFPDGEKYNDYFLDNLEELESNGIIPQNRMKDINKIRELLRK